MKLRRDTTGSCRAHSPALHVGRRDRVAQWSWSCTSHPHAHLHAQLGLICLCRPIGDHRSTVIIVCTQATAAWRPLFSATARSVSLANSWPKASVRKTHFTRRRLAPVAPRRVRCARASSSKLGPPLPSVGRNNVMLCHVMSASWSRPRRRLVAAA